MGFSVQDAVPLGYAEDTFFLVPSWILMSSTVTASYLLECRQSDVSTCSGFLFRDLMLNPQLNNEERKKPSLSDSAAAVLAQLGLFPRELGASFFWRPINSKFFV